MGIGPVALNLYADLANQGLIMPRQSICELGSQDVCPENFQMAQLFLEFAHPGGHYESSRALMTALGFDYTCIDMDGKYGALKLDLNIATYGDLDYRTFDNVTNHGTTEHVFDQANCFRLIHDLTKEGGLMVHIVPTRGLGRSLGYDGHGLFLYSSGLFGDLALSNGYQMVRCYWEEDLARAL